MRLQKIIITVFWFLGLFLGNFSKVSVGYFLETSGQTCPKKINVIADLLRIIPDKFILLFTYSKRSLVTFWSFNWTHHNIQVSTRTCNIFLVNSSIVPISCTLWQMLTFVAGRNMFCCSTSLKSHCVNQQTQCVISFCQERPCCGENRLAESEGVRFCSFTVDLLRFQDFRHFCSRAELLLVG